MGAKKHIPLGEILTLYYERGMNFEQIAKALRCQASNIRRRVRKYEAIKAGEQNADGRALIDPGQGRRIRGVTTQVDKQGEIRFQSIREVVDTQDQQDFHVPLAYPKRVSTLVDADGHIKQQWQISTGDQHRLEEHARQVIEGFKAEIPIVTPSVPKAMHQSANIEPLFVLSDAHIGALGWAPEGGGDWDLKIAQETWVKAMGAMIAASPPAEQCTIAILGDFTHYDMLEAVTTLSRNVLDSDGRQPKMNKVAIEVARAVVQMALDHYAKVRLLVAEGNHDLVAAAWLRELFILHYEAEPRVDVIDEVRPYYAFMAGDTMLCFHHGHLKGARDIKSAEALTAIFADEYRQMWGQAKHVEIHTGHFHFPNENNPRGARVVQHPTLATRTAWEARSGWGSIRQAKSLIYHHKYGRTGSVEISPEMLA